MTQGPAGRLAFFIGDSRLAGIERADKPVGALIVERAQTGHVQALMRDGQFGRPTLRKAICNDHTEIWVACDAARA